MAGGDRKEYSAHFQYNCTGICTLMSGKKIGSFNLDSEVIRGLMLL